MQVNTFFDNKPFPARQLNKPYVYSIFCAVCTSSVNNTTTFSLALKVEVLYYRYYRDTSLHQTVIPVKVGVIWLSRQNKKVHSFFYNAILVSCHENNVVIKKC